MPPSTPDLTQLQARLDRLEQRCRRLWIVATLALLLAVVLSINLFVQGLWWFEAAALLGTIKTESIILRDPQGKTRLQMYVNNQGTFLGIHDANEQHRLFLNVDDQGQAGLAFVNHDGSIQMHLAGLLDKTTLGLYDPAGRLGVELNYGEKGQGLYLFRPDGSHRAWLASDPTGTPGLVLFDAGGTKRASLTALPREAVLALNGGDAKQRLQFLVDARGMPAVRMFDANERLRVYLGNDSKESSLIFHTSNARRCLGLGQVSNLGTGFFLNDTSGQQRAWLAVDAKGRSEFRLLDAQGKVIFAKPDRPDPAK